jgi:hypothetical protein
MLGYMNLHDKTHQQYVVAIPGIKLPQYVLTETSVFTLRLMFGIMQIWHSLQLLKYTNIIKMVRKPGPPQFQKPNSLAFAKQ